MDGILPPSFLLVPSSTASLWNCGDVVPSAGWLGNLPHPRYTWSERPLCNPVSTSILAGVKLKLRSQSKVAAVCDVLSNPSVGDHCRIVVDNGLLITEHVVTARIMLIGKYDGVGGGHRGNLIKDKSGLIASSIVGDALLRPVYQARIFQVLYSASHSLAGTIAYKRCGAETTPCLLPITKFSATKESSAQRARSVHCKDNMSRLESCRTRMVY